MFMSKPTLIPANDWYAEFDDEDDLARVVFWRVDGDSVSGMVAIKGLPELARCDEMDDFLSYVHEDDTEDDDEGCMIFCGCEGDNCAAECEIDEAINAEEDAAVSTTASINDNVPVDAN